MAFEEYTDNDSDFIEATDKNPSNILPEKLTLDSALQFACHPQVSCFTACCHNIFNKSCFLLSVCCCFLILLKNALFIIVKNNMWRDKYEQVTA